MKLDLDRLFLFHKKTSFSYSAGYLQKYNQVCTFSPLINVIFKDKDWSWRTMGDGESLQRAQL